jgi:hypothetical protein
MGEDWANVRIGRRRRLLRSRKREKVRRHPRRRPAAGRAVESGGAAWKMPVSRQMFPRYASPAQGAAYDISVDFLNRPNSADYL